LRRENLTITNGELEKAKVQDNLEVKVCRETGKEGGTNISQPRRELRVYNHVRSNLLQLGTCHERTEIWHKTSTTSTWIK
jgi:hypothetical protein